MKAQGHLWIVFACGTDKRWRPWPSDDTGELIAHPTRKAALRHAYEEACVFRHIRAYKFKPQAFIMGFSKG